MTRLRVVAFLFCIDILVRFGKGYIMTERANYFVMQKLVGIAVLLFSAIVTGLCGDASICVITIPIAVVLIFTKKMLIANQYYFDHGGEDQWT